MNRDNSTGRAARAEGVKRVRAIWPRARSSKGWKATTPTTTRATLGSNRPRADATLAPTVGELSVRTTQANSGDGRPGWSLSMSRRSCSAVQVSKPAASSAFIVLRSAHRRVPTTRMRPTGPGRGSGPDRPSGRVGAGSDRAGPTWAALSVSTTAVSL